MAKTTMRNIQRGDIVGVACRDHEPDQCEFLGFTNHGAKHSQLPVYKTWLDLAGEYGYTSFADQDETELARCRHTGNGHRNYAVFRDISEALDMGVFTAYLYNGRWCLGSSADPLRLTD